MADEHLINPSTGNLDKVRSNTDLDLRYLKLDQTTPQTTTGIFSFPSLTVDTNTLVANAAGYEDKVGIGNSSPSCLLAIGANATDIGGVTKVASITANDNSIQALQLENLNSGTASEMRFVAVNDAGQYLAFTVPSSGNTGTFLGTPKAGSAFIFATGINPNLVTGTLQSGYYSFGTVNVERMRITTDGDIGVGTTAPDRNFEINTGAATGGIRLTYNDANGSATVYSDLLVDSAGTLFISPTGRIDLTGSNIIYVPIGGSIANAITAATAGDTIVLGAGTYTITAALAVNKALNIVGQGMGKTTINSATANTNVITVTASNVRISDLTITHSGAGSNINGIYFNGTAGTVLSGGVVERVEFLLTGAVSSASAPMRFEDAGGRVVDCITSSTGGTNAYGIYFRNAATAEAATNLYVYNTKSIAVGTAAVRGFLNLENANTQNQNLYLYNCHAQASGGTTNYGIYGFGNSSLTYIYGGQYSGSTYDLIQDESAAITVYGVDLINGTTSGTITYDGTVVTEDLYVSDQAGIGTTTPISNLHIEKAGTALNANLYATTDSLVVSDNLSVAFRGITASDTATTKAGITFIKARGTVLNPTVVQINETLGEVIFQGFDGTTRKNAAAIQAFIDNTPGANDMPGRLTFSTTPDGSTTLTERMRIDSSGNVGIGTTAPDRKLEINTGAATGGLRLTYNDADGSATVYADFLIDSNGDLEITATGGDISFGNENIGTTGAVKGVHKAADGTAAVADGTYTVGIGGTTNGTITIKDGIITAVQQAVA